MFQSRISGAARAAGKSCMVERSVAKLVERISSPDEVSLMLIDLTLTSIDLAEDIPALHQAFPKGKILAYGPHVDVERLTLAQTSGADAVMTRGQFDRDLLEILAGA